MIEHELNHVPIETLLFSVGGEEAVRKFEQIETEQTPTEYHDMRTIAEMVQFMTQDIEKMGRQKRWLELMLERKLMPL